MLRLLVLRRLQRAQFNRLQLTFSFSEVFVLKQVWEMTMSEVLSAVLPLLIGTQQN